MIRILLTGGTIDKSYLPLEGRLDFFKSHIDMMLSQGRCTAETVSEVLTLKDSLELTEEDRNRLLERCNVAHEEQLVIVHGTDTIAETAQLIAGLCLEKTIVMVGAMIPYAVNSSDALFNLGAAITAVQLLSNGVYLTMNGEIYNAGGFRKNHQAGRFERQ